MLRHKALSLHHLEKKSLAEAIGKIYWLVREPLLIRQERGKQRSSIHGQCLRKRLNHLETRP